MSVVDTQWTSLIIAHTLLAVSAIVIGALLLLKNKGTFNHRLFGWIWVLMMALVALLSFGIQRDGFSWIHLLSVFTLFMLTVGVRNIKNKKIVAHEKTMKGIYFGALVITGIFTLLPSRLIGGIFFG
jgi:hypothetical protein